MVVIAVVVVRHVVGRSDGAIEVVRHARKLEHGGLQLGLVRRRRRRAHAELKKVQDKFGLSDYQMLWLSFGKGFIIGAILL